MYKRRHFPTISFLLALAITGLLLLAFVACSRSTPTPPPSSQGEQRVIPGETVAPSTRVVQHTLATPTPLPTPTTEPFPPIVTAISPEPGSEIRPDASIELHFSAAIDPKSIHNALEIRPNIRGSLEVQGNVVRFVPQDPFPWDRDIIVRIKSTVKSVSGLSMLRPLTYRFHTMTPLRITRHYPITKAIQVPIDASVRLNFNRAVVPVDQTNRPLTPPTWFHITPAIKGHVRWVGSSLLEFTPDAYFLSGTVYTVTVTPPLYSLDHAPLLHTHTFSFTVAYPRVERVILSKIDAYIWPNKPFTVTFNLPMDKTSVEQGVHLEHLNDNTQVPLTFTWIDDRTVEILPKRMLTLGERYRIRIDQSVRSADRHSTLQTPFHRTVRVIPRLRVGSTDPANGDTRVSVYKPVYILFQGLPDPKSVPENIRVEPKPRQIYSHTIQSRLILNFPKKPRTTYTITLKKDLKDIFGNPLGEDVSFHFTTGDLPPILRTNWPYGRVMFPVGEPISLTVQEVNIKSINFRLYRKEEQALISFYAKGGAPYTCMVDPADELLREWDVILPAQRNAWHTRAIPIQVGDTPLEPGVYFLCLKAEGPSRPMENSYLLLVTPYNIVLKSSAKELLAWVTDLHTGEPVPGQRLTFHSASFQAEGVTDEDGMAWIDQGREKPWERTFVLVHSDDGRVVGMATDEWNNGISPWNFHLPVEYIPPAGLVAYFQTDRPVYRPGQTIHWKLIVRQDDDGTYTLPPPDTRVQLNIIDPAGEPILQQEVRLNDMGTAHGDLPLTPSAKVGYYNIWVEGAEILDKPYLLVAAYRKPEFEIHVTADPPEVIDGETIRVTAQARYYFGAPVANARVKYTVVDAPYHFSWTCPTSSCPHYSFSDQDWWTWPSPSERGKPLAQGTGRTDEKGRFLLTLPARLKPDQSSRRWRVEISVMDVSGQLIAGRTWVVVHKAAVYPGIAARSYVARVNTPVHVDVILVDVKGRPQPRKTVTFIAYRQRWHNVRKKDATGVFRWVSEVEETPVYTTTLTLDQKGRGSVEFIPTTGGSYRLRLLARDDQGREARASQFIWVSQSTYVSWRRENNNRVFLVADKTSYKVGETAHILIPSPYRTPVRALLTLERGRIRKAWTVTLTSNSDIIDVPITEDMAPNVFLSVFLVRGAKDAADGHPSFRVGYVELPVDISERLLEVIITPEQKKYHPRDTARFSLSVRNAEGKPVDAEVALALVDKAVLDLVERPTPLAQVFYRKRGLQVHTGTALAITPYRLRPLEPGGKGGGGGGGYVPAIRETFLDVAYWEPTLRTGSQGRARVAIPLPDNLTTWVLHAWAVDEKTRVGEADAEILVTQEFLLRPVLPRFFTQGDRADIGVVAHNLSDTPVRGRITIHVEGATLKTPAVQEVMLQPGQHAKLTWPIENVEGQGTPTVLRVTWKGETNVPGLADAVRITLPVQYPLPPDIQAVAGLLKEDGSTVEGVGMPPNRIPTRGGIRMDVDASLAGGILDGLRYLRHYPWECVEQTTSRFLANVITWRALKHLDIQNPELETILPDLVTTAIQRLQARQHPDGGWGWWEGGRSDLYITAYALWALTEAHQAGFDIPENMWARAATYINRHLRSYTPGEKVWKNNRAAMALFALTMYSRERHVLFPGQYAAAVNLFHARKHMSLYARALLGLTFGTFEESGLLDADATENAHKYLQRILNELDEAAIIDPTGAHWEEDTWDIRHMNNDVHTTAVVFLLLTHYDAENPLNPRVVRWLSTQRQGKRWHHTHDTAWALVALTDWMEYTQELHPDYDYSVWFNDHLWFQGTMTPHNMDTTRSEWKPIQEILNRPLNLIRIQRSHRPGQTGKGALYYRIQLITYPSQDKLKPVQRGIRVERWYTVGEEETPVSRARVGDIITVHIRIIAARSLHYFMLQDFFPAGVEPLNIHLKTTPSTVREIKLKREASLPWAYWTPSHVELRDDRAGIFDEYLPAGTHEITYQVRASLPGTFIVPPARASLMYEPEIFGWSDLTTFVVEPSE